MKETEKQNIIVTEKEKKQEKQTKYYTLQREETVLLDTLSQQQTKN